MKSLTLWTATFVNIFSCWNFLAVHLYSWQNSRESADCKPIRETFPALYAELGQTRDAIRWHQLMAPKPKLFFYKGNIGEFYTRRASFLPICYGVDTWRMDQVLWFSACGPFIPTWPQNILIPPTPPLFFFFLFIVCWYGSEQLGVGRWYVRLAATWQWYSPLHF